MNVGDYCRIKERPGLFKIVAVLDKGEAGLFYKLYPRTWVNSSEVYATNENSESVELWTLKNRGGE